MVVGVLVVVVVVVVIVVLVVVVVAFDVGGVVVYVGVVNIGVVYVQYNCSTCTQLLKQKANTETPTTKHVISHANLIL